MEGRGKGLIPGRLFLLKKIKKQYPGYFVLHKDNLKSERFSETDRKGWTNHVENAASPLSPVD